MRTRIFINFAVCLFLIGLFLRLYRLGEVPTGLYWDETAILVDVRSVVESWHDMHGNFFLQAIYPSYGDYKAPGLPIIASLVAFGFGVSSWSLRLVLVLAWILSTIAGLGCLWLVLQNTHRRNRQMVSLAFLAITSVAPWSFFFSRVAFESFLSQAWMLVSVFFLLASFHSTNKKSHGVLLLAFSVLFGAAAGYTYFAARYIWSGLLGLLVCFQFLTIKKKTPVLLIKLGGKFVLLLLAYYILLLPLTRSPLYQNSQAYRLSTKSLVSEEAQLSQVLASNYYKDLAGNSFLSKLVFHRKVFFLKEFARNVADHLAPNYLFAVGDSNLRHGTGRQGLLLLTFVPLVIFGAYTLWRKRPSLLLLFCGWYLVAIVPASFAEETPHAMRSLVGLFPLLAVVSFGLVACINYWQKSQAKWSKMLLFGWLLLLCFDVFSYFYYYFGAYRQASARAWQTGYNEIVTLVENNREADEKVLLSFPDGRLYLWFLASGTYSAQELQSLPYEAYQVTSFDKLDFRDVVGATKQELEQYAILFLSQSQAEQVSAAVNLNIIDSLQMQDVTYVLARSDWSQR
ncbi:MAG: hypothetical protein UY10_C0019G0002 [Microgenomates group bacterium GW2011_GWA2_47_8]|nr:MAG: hypothetical protein UY10_C0019G0002 [Microgenomates group bacterium GW2011_GWA2_47_8]